MVNAYRPDNQRTSFVSDPEEVAQEQIAQLLLLYDLDFMNTEENFVEVADYEEVWLEKAKQTFNSLFRICLSNGKRSLVMLLPKSDRKKLLTIEMCRSLVHYIHKISQGVQNDNSE